MEIGGWGRRDYDGSGLDDKPSDFVEGHAGETPGPGRMRAIILPDVSMDAEIIDDIPARVTDEPDWLRQRIKASGGSKFKRSLIVSIGIHIAAIATIVWWINENPVVTLGIATGKPGAGAVDAEEKPGTKIDLSVLMAMTPQTADEQIKQSQLDPEKAFRPPDFSIVAPLPVLEATNAMPVDLDISIGRGVRERWHVPFVEKSPRGVMQQLNQDDRSTGAMEKAVAAVDRGQVDQKQSAVAMNVREGQGQGVEQMMAGNGGALGAPSPSGRNKAPTYPPDAIRKGMTGTVMLRVEVLPSGAVRRVELEQSSGHGILDESALLAVGKWSFEMNGQAEAVELTLPIRFSLNR